MRPSARSEDGVALVTGLLVSAVVLTLSVTAVSLSIHNTGASSLDRSRLLSINAAEAGIDQYYALLGSRSYTLIPGATTASTCVLTGTLSGTPSSTYTVTPQYYTSSAAADAGTGGTTCPQSSPTRSTYVVLRSVGTITGHTTPKRTMTSKARLSLSTSTGAFPTAAIYGATNVNLSANIDVRSASGANDANVYSSGNLTVNTQSNIYGSLYVQGTATVANGRFWARGDLWANNAVTISGGKISGAVTSSTSTIAVSGNTYVGSAKAGGAITVQNPATIYGTQSPNTSGIGPPPSYTYPTYTWNAADWPSYQTASTCAAAQTLLNNWTTGALYIRLTSCTNFAPTTFPVMSNLPGNLGIISDGPLELTTSMHLASTGSYNVYLFTGVTGTNCNFQADSNSSIGSNLKVLVYTPSTCSATMLSNSSFASGQIFSGSVILKSNSPLTFAAVSLPGTTSDSSGSLVDIVYKREVAST
jgi:hypothetical protein